ncbi:Formin-binding protein 1 [Nymphon striatum]|nr:Formin-binding protein 1 [Nymphon striatum]
MDQYDNIGTHTQKGLDFLEKYGHFIKDRCAIEMEYASKLRKLVKNYIPKKKEDDDQSTTSKAFVCMMNEVNDLAGQHEIISENLSTQIIKEISSLLREIKDERKKFLQNGSKLQANLLATKSQLEKVKKVYEKAFKESEKAQENYQKADADLNLSRAEVEKARSLASSKNQVSESSKNDYANQLQKFNDLQKLHYNELMPTIFQQLQELDEKRMEKIQNFIKTASGIEKQVIPIVVACLDGMIKSAESIDPQSDTGLVIEKFKSGYDPPSELPFEDLSNRQNGDENGSTLSGSGGTPIFKSETFRGTLSAGKLKKRGGIFGIFSSSKQTVIDEPKEDFSDYPPSQRRKKLQAKVDQMQCDINQSTSAREGLMKMKDVYEQNPNLGDPMSIEGQLSENSQHIEKLQSELRKFENFLAECEGKPLPHRLSPQIHKRTSRNSISDESLSRSASDSSVSYPPNNFNCVNKETSVPGTPIPSHECLFSCLLLNVNVAIVCIYYNPSSSNSPESGIGTCQVSIQDEEEFDTCDGDGDNVDHDEYYVEPLPVLATCQALYPFDGHDEGSLSLYRGEELFVIEYDQGDGWTKVRKESYEEGFVPTAYVHFNQPEEC